MKTRIPAVVLAATLQAMSFAAFAQGKACALVTPAELEAALGGKVTLSASTLPGGVEVCNGKAGASTVMVRLFKRTTDPEGEKEKAGVTQLSKLGATVELRKVGPISCMSAAPGPKLAGHPFTTSCTASKPPMYAVIEIGNPKEAFAIGKLRPVAEKMLTRF